MPDRFSSLLTAFEISSVHGLMTGVNVFIFSHGGKGRVGGGGEGAVYACLPCRVVLGWIGRFGHLCFGKK